MSQIYCPFCENSIRIGDEDQEVACKNCGRRFPIESENVYSSINFKERKK